MHRAATLDSPNFHHHRFPVDNVCLTLGSFRPATTWLPHCSPKRRRTTHGEVCLSSSIVSPPSAKQKQEVFALTARLISDLCLLSAVWSRCYGTMSLALEHCEHCEDLPAASSVSNTSARGSSSQTTINFSNLAYFLACQTSAVVGWACLPVDEPSKDVQRSSRVPLVKTAHVYYRVRCGSRGLECCVCNVHVVAWSSRRAEWVEWVGGTGRPCCSWRGRVIWREEAAPHQRQIFITHFPPMSCMSDRGQSRALLTRWRVEHELRLEYGCAHNVTRTY